MSCILCFGIEYLLTSFSLSYIQSNTFNHLRLPSHHHFALYCFSQHQVRSKNNCAFRKTSSSTNELYPTCKSLRFVGWNRSQVSKVTLVADKHDDDVCVGVIPQLFQPALDVLVSQMLGNIVDQKSSNCTTIVPEVFSNAQFNAHLRHDKKREEEQNGLAMH